MATKDNVSTKAIRKVTTMVGEIIRYNRQPAAPHLSKDMNGSKQNEGSTFFVDPPVALIGFNARNLP